MKKIQIVWSSKLYIAPYFLRERPCICKLLLRFPSFCKNVNALMKQTTAFHHFLIVAFIKGQQHKCVFPYFKGKEQLFSKKKKMRLYVTA